MSKIPGWAMEMADKVAKELPIGELGVKTLSKEIAKALVVAELRGIERAAVEMEHMRDTIALSDNEVERVGMFVRQTNNADRAAAIRQLGDEE